MKIWQYSLCLLLLTYLLACGPTYEYEVAIDLPDSGWQYQDSLVADFSIEDTTTYYDLFLEITHTPDFPYENFYLQVHTQFPEGERLSEQFSVQLAGKAGVWLGDCNSSTCTILIPVRKGVFFSQQGDYQIVFEQFSRRNPLPAVQRVRFALGVHEEKK